MYDGRVPQGRRRIRNEAAVYPQDVFALMDHPELKRIALVGHDRGRTHRDRFANDHSARVDRLVVMDNVPTRTLAELLLSCVAL
jgi:haloacetate dehalogenase